MKPTLHLFTTLVLILFVQACSNDKLSNEDQIRAFIETNKSAVENHSSTEIGKQIHSNYSDHIGLNKSQLLGLSERYFFMHKNIHLLTKIDEIVFHSDNKALVKMYVAMASNVITNTNSLTSLRAKIYKFELQLIHQDKWLLQLADWKTSNVKEMMNSLHTRVETIQ